MSLSLCSSGVVDVAVVVVVVVAIAAAAAAVVFVVVVVVVVVVVIVAAAAVVHIIIIIIIMGEVSTSRALVAVVVRAYLNNRYGLEIEPGHGNAARGCRQSCGLVHL